MEIEKEIEMEMEMSDMRACRITLDRLFQVEVIESGKDRRTLLR